MSQAKREKHALRFLKMDGNAAAAARRSGMPEQQIRYRLSNDDAWADAQEQGRRRKEHEEKLKAERDYHALKGAAVSRRIAADQYRKKFFQELAALSHAQIAERRNKWQALEAQALDAESEYFKQRHARETAIHPRSKND